MDDALKLTQIEVDAFRIVDARLDAGVMFERRFREPGFMRAVEMAREMRAYTPGKLRFIVRGLAEFPERYIASS